MKNRWSVMTALLLVTWNDDNNYTQLNTDFSFSTIDSKIM